MLCTASSAETAYAGASQAPCQGNTASTGSCSHALLLLQMFSLINNQFGTLPSRIAEYSPEPVRALKHLIGISALKQPRLDISWLQPSPPKQLEQQHVGQVHVRMPCL